MAKLMRGLLAALLIVMASASQGLAGDFSSDVLQKIKPGLPP